MEGALRILPSGWSDWRREGQLNKGVHHQIARGRGKGGFTHVRWSNISPVNVETTGSAILPDILQAYFPHPCDPEAKIYVFLDACHMIKLVRKAMSDWKVLKDKDGKRH